MTEPSGRELGVKYSMSGMSCPIRKIIQPTYCEKLTSMVELNAG
jgi:hypothetical protein